VKRGGSGPARGVADRCLIPEAEGAGVQKAWNYGGLIRIGSSIAINGLSGSSGTSMNPSSSGTAACGSEALG